MNLTRSEFALIIGMIASVGAAAIGVIWALWAVIVHGHINALFAVVGVVGVETLILVVCALRIQNARNADDQHGRETGRGEVQTL